jgi:hypothetical protein
MSVYYQLTTEKLDEKGVWNVNALIEYGNLETAKEAYDDAGESKDITTLRAVLWEILVDDTDAIVCKTILATKMV